LTTKRKLPEILGKSCPSGVELTQACAGTVWNLLPVSLRLVDTRFRHLLKAYSFDLGCGMTFCFSGAVYKLFHLLTYSWCCVSVRL